MLKATKESSRMDNQETLPTLGNQDTGHGETKTHNTTQIKKKNNTDATKTAEEEVPVSSMTPAMLHI